MSDSANPPRRAITVGVSAEVDAVALKLSEIWAQVMGSPLSPKDDIFELGIDSLTLILFITAVEDQLKVSLPFDVIFASDSLTDIAGALLRGSSAEPDSGADGVHP